MSTVRNVTVISTQKNAPVVYPTPATTWGQLRDLITRDFGNVGEMKAVIKETRNSLDVADAVLPEGNFTVFLTQTKIKAGAVDQSEVLSALKDEFVTAFDRVQERLEAGEFDVDADHENAVANSSNSAISAADRNALAELQAQFTGR
jgi:hypothetical protein